MVSSKPVTQAEFARAVGVSQQAISVLVKANVLPDGAPADEWLLAYCGRLREQAAGRMGEGGDLDLVQERAALAREQKEHYAIKNAVARGEYAPIGLLADVLSAAAGAVVDRFDALPNLLRQVCPDLPAAARDAIATTIANARNEWIRGTAELVVRRLEDGEEDDGGEPVPA